MGGRGARVGRVEVGQRPAQLGAHVFDQRAVERRPAHRVDAVRAAEQFEPAGVGLPHHRALHRPAAQAVHGEQVAAVHPVAPGVVLRRRQGFRQQGDVLQAVVDQLPVQFPPSVGAPVGRMGDDHVVGVGALLGGHVLHHPDDHGRGQGGGGVGLAADDHGDLVADAAVEVARQVGVPAPPARRGRLARQHRSVLGQPQHGGDRGGVVAKPHHLDLAPARVVQAAERGSGVAAANVYAQDVRHAGSSSGGRVVRPTHPRGAP